METLQFFVGHPISETLPLIDGVPWKLSTILFCIIFAIKYVLPRWMTSKEPFDLKPIILIYNGILFGCNGAGLMLCLWVTDFASISFDCSPIDSNITEIKPFFTIYLAYIFFWLHLTEMIPRIAEVLEKRRLKYDALDIAADLSFLVMIYLGLKYYPGKAASFFPTITLAFGLLDCAMRVCASAGPPIVNVNYWSKPFFYLKIVHQTLLLTHGYFILNLPSCQNIIRLGLLEIIASTINLINIVRNGQEAWIKAKCIKDD